MKEAPKDIPFNAWLDFNNQIFTDLDEKIRPLLAKETSSLSRELQIRTMLYTNFNNYLTLLLTKVDDSSLTVLENLNTLPEDERLEVIVSIINKPLKKIKSDFIDLFSKAK